MRTLGIEFGSWSLKAVEIETRFRRMEVLDFHEIRLPLEITDPQETFRQAVTTLMDRLPHHPEKLVTSLPMSQTALRFFHLPIKQAKKVEQMYRFELEDNVPFKLENSIVEHHITKTNEGSLVAAAMSPKVHIQSHLDWLQGVGVDPDWLTFDGMGLTNLYLRQFGNPKAKKKSSEEDEEESNIVAVLDIGHLKAGLAIIDENRLEFYRSLPWGGAHISHAIGNALGISLDDAEKKKQQELNISVDASSLSGDLQTLVQAAQKSFSLFFTDIQHTLVAFRSQSKKAVDRVLITGGTSSLEGLPQFLSNRLKKPVSVFNPLRDQAAAHDLPESSMVRFGESFGRATVFERKAALLFNFRKHEMAKKTSLTEVGTVLKDPHVVQVLKYAGALAIILFIHVTVATNLAKEEAQASKKELSKVFSQTFRNTPKKLRLSLTKNPAALKKYIRQRNREIKQKLKMVSAKRTPVVELIDAISKAFPSTTKVDVNSLNIDDRSVLIRGILYEGDLKEVREKLESIPSFSDIKLSLNGKNFSFRGQIEGR